MRHGLYLHPHMRSQRVVSTGSISVLESGGKSRRAPTLPSDEPVSVGKLHSGAPLSSTLTTSLGITISSNASFLSIRCSDVGFTDIVGFFIAITRKTGNPVTRQGITLKY